MSLGTFLASAATAVSLIGLITFASSYVRMMVVRRRRPRQPRDSPLRPLSAVAGALGTVAIAATVSGALLLVIPLLWRSGR